MKTDHRFKLGAEAVLKLAYSKTQFKSGDTVIVTGLYANNKSHYKVSTLNEQHHAYVDENELIATKPKVRLYAYKSDKGSIIFQSEDRGHGLTLRPVDYQGVPYSIKHDRAPQYDHYITPIEN